MFLLLGRCLEHPPVADAPAQGKNKLSRERVYCEKRLKRRGFKPKKLHLKKQNI